jgi:flavin prenyltransferase
VRPLVLGVTGASGALYARRLARHLLDLKAPVHLVVSEAAKRVIAEELDIRPFSTEKFLEGSLAGLTVHGNKDVGAAIASGSYLTAGMVVCPCSSHTLAAIASGLGDNLITRAAMVTLKEARRLIVVPRETPLSPIELENMLRISRAGGIICPASPGFYMKPRRVEDLVDFVVGRVLDLLGVEHSLRTRWNPAEENEKS